MESAVMVRKQLSREWLEGSRKRLEIAHHTRYSNPRVTLEIVIQILDELLSRLPRETEEQSNMVSAEKIASKGLGLQCTRCGEIIYECTSMADYNKETMQERNRAHERTCKGTSSK